MSEVVRRRPAAGARRKVPLAWEALEDAFENNAPEVRSYLHLNTGEVVRVVEGVADPAMHSRIAADPTYLHVDPVSSREQYRWMERFIESVNDPELRPKLDRAIDGKGAFRRFKDVLMSYPLDRERWFAFRSDRLRVAIQAWLDANDIEVIERPEWRVPTAEEVKPQVDPGTFENDARRSRAAAAAALRERLREAVDLLAARDLEMAVAFVDFLRERKHTPRVKAKAASSGDVQSTSPGSAPPPSPSDPPSVEPRAIEEARESAEPPREG